MKVSERGMSMRLFRHGPAPGTLVSGFLISIAFPPLEFHLLIWVALIPWLLTLRRCKSLVDAVGQGFWLNFLTGLGLSHWIVYAVPQYLGVSLVFGFIALCVYGLCSQLQFVVFAPIFHWLVRRGHGPLAIRRLVLAALLYTGLDWMIPNLFQDMELPRFRGRLSVWDGLPPRRSVRDEPGTIEEEW